MTFLAVPIFGRSIEEIRRACQHAVGAGAELIELRLDLIDGVSDEDLRSLRDEPGVPIILTLRSTGEGGQWDGGDDERISRLIELGPIADYIDVELAVWQRSANIRQKISLALKRAGHISQADGKEEIELAAKRKLILSKHDLQGRPPKLHADLLAMLSEPSCSVPKLAWRARTVRDNFEAFDLLRTSPRPAIVICMGEDGLLSRVLARKFGAFATFAAESKGAETASGQPPIDEMTQAYRWNAIDEATEVYGVIGDPIRHSLSPAVHNALLAATAQNAVYLPLRVEASYESFKAFMVEAMARPWLHFRGFSVTSPHKENASRFVSESGGHIDELAARLGAVNTITVSPDGALAGYNTDYAAGLRAICDGLRCRPADLAMSSVAVLGAGGVARAVVAALRDAGATVTIYNRSDTKARQLARALGCECKPWRQRLEAQADLVVNCTSVGMWPNAEATPLPGAVFRSGMAVFDAIYRPRRTKLLQDAYAHGCTVIDGLSMFVIQAESQFQLWTGRSPPPAVAGDAAESALRPEADSRAGGL